MRHFVNLSERTPEYVQAVDALSRLMETAGDHLALRAFAEAVSEERAEQWAKDAGLTRSGRPCIERLQGRQCRGVHRCHPPATDHPSLWLKDGKPAVFVSQPYGLSWRSLQEIVAYCRAHGLEADVHAGLSWHFPGWTVAVFFRRAAAEMPQREDACDDAPGATVEPFSKRIRTLPKTGT